MSTDLKLIVDGIVYTTVAGTTTGTDADRDDAYEPEIYDPVGGSPGTAGGRGGNWIDMRRHERRCCRIEVEYARDDRLFRDAISDMSTGGVFLRTRNTMDVGDLLFLTIPFNSRSVRVKGEVVRVTAQGAGIAFLK